MQVYSRLNHVCVSVSYNATLKLVNPRRACAARVTVLGLCVCVCVSTLISALRATKRMMSDTNGFYVTSARKIKWQFS